MKKFLIIVGISTVVLTGAAIGTVKVLDNMSLQEQKSEQEKIMYGPVAKAAEQEKVEKEQEVKEQTGKIGGIQYDLLIDSTSSESEVIDVMHKMTHQKVRAEDKWGAIPMIPDTINQVYDIVSQSDFSRKEDLLEILEKWKKDDFSTIDDDHNYFWEYQDGTIGEAYGTLTLDEEKEFIKNNYKDEVANEMLNNM